MQFAGAPSSTAKRPVTARAAGGLFFPQRLILKLDTHGYSRSILQKIIEAGAQLKSFKVAAQMLERLAETPISARHVGRITHEIGAELAEARDQRTHDWIHYQAYPRVESAPQAVAVAVDGGRIMTRASGQGPGVHGQSWKEDKVACLQTLQGPTFDADPKPEPPACFLDHRYVADLTRELKSRNGLAGKDPEESLTSGSSAPPPAAQGESGKSRAKPSWPPARLVRTCVATQRNIDAFGPMVAAEANARNFDKAPRRAFLGDGQACNWTMKERWFADYRAIVDFIHPLAYVYLAAAGVTKTLAERWTLYAAWITAIWQGRVVEVIAALQEWQARLGPIPDKPPADDPRLPIAAAITYLGNNQGRMDYPQYRKEGLPITTSAVESLIKEFNYRVKGTEKFWNTPSGTETILQARAAVLSDDERLSKHMESRPGNPFRRRRPQGEHGKATLAA